MKTITTDQWEALEAALSALEAAKDACGNAWEKCNQLGSEDVDLDNRFDSSCEEAIADTLREIASLANLPILDPVTCHECYRILREDATEGDLCEYCEREQEGD